MRTKEYYLRKYGGIPKWNDIPPISFRILPTEKRRLVEPMGRGSISSGVHTFTLVYAFSTNVWFCEHEGGNATHYDWIQKEEFANEED